MNAKKTDLKELEGWYEKSGNQLMLLYGGMDCRKEQLIKEFCVIRRKPYHLFWTRRRRHESVI